MTAFIIVVSIILLVVLILQISRLTELYARIRGEEEVELRSNRNQGRAMLLFMIGLLALCVITAWGWKNYMMGYGPHESASAHGGVLDNMFDVTLFFTGIVFVLTHVALFYFAWRYKKTKNSRGTHWPHNNTLEIVWSAVPAVVMTYLVIKGLLAWNTVMADVEKDEDHIEIEATGYQFAWHLRYPGPDGVLGARDYKLTTAENPLGQDWTDPKNLDDIHPDELWLPVNKKVRVRIMARDVLHNFYLPHFRVKMDAVPGLPTYFVFTPTKTTEEYREMLRDYPEYNKPVDPDDPESPMMWEDFNYELACAELCGRSHYSMRRIVRIVSEEEYNMWLSKQQSFYVSSIKGKMNDPHRNMPMGYDKDRSRRELNSSVETALGLNLISEDTTLTEAAREGITAEGSAPVSEGDKNTVRLDYIDFDPGSATMTKDARSQLVDLADVLKKYPEMKIEIGVHSDNRGDAEANKSLTQRRAEAIKIFLGELGVDPSRVEAVGYGSSKPLEQGDTPEARQKNRRTEFRILSQ